MHEVKVYDSSGNLKEVVSTKVLNVSYISYDFFELILI